MDASKLPRGQRRCVMAGTGILGLGFSGLLFGIAASAFCWAAGIPFDFRWLFLAGAAIAGVAGPFVLLRPEWFGKFISQEFAREFPGAVRHLRQEWNRLP